MVSSNYYGKQAQTFAAMALATANEAMAQRYNQMALEYLARAETPEPSTIPLPHVIDEGGLDTDRTG
jgi:hypothetical protein